MTDMDADHRRDGAGDPVTHDDQVAGSDDPVDRPEDDAGVGHGSETDDGGRIEIVAEPIRYRRTPLVGLLIAAVIPAIGLFWLARWTDTEADTYEAERLAIARTERRAPDPGWLEPDLEGSISEELLADADGGGDVADDVADDAVRLDTVLLDYRRTPDAVSSLASAQRLAVEIEPIFGFLGPRSCASFRVDGVAVADHNPDVAVIPASTQKLIVAAVALDVLGPDHRFTTSVAVPSPVDGVVEGDIYLIGGGDPLLTSNDFPLDDDPRPAFATTSFDVLADAVAATGVETIRGSVIGDGSRYDDEWVIGDWADGIAGVDAGPYDALLANDGRIVGRSGRPDDPNEAAAREFVRLLGERGVRVDNGWGSGARSTLVPIVGSVESEPMTAVVAEMLTTSDNNTAEMLLKEIGVVAAENGSRAAGLSVVRDRLTEWGIDVDELTLVDGSGLSAGNRLTCGALVEILHRFRGTALDAGLPIAARTGTLTDEFVESPMLGRLRAKTGTLPNEPFDADPPAAKALAGYVDADGATVEFALLVNSSDVTLPNRYQPLWGAMGERLATFPDGPAASELAPRS